MRLELDDIKRLATEVARDENPALDVVGVITGGGASGYTEILITVRGCAPEDCLISVGVDRHATEAVVRASLAEKIRAHLREHGVVSSQT